MFSTFNYKCEMMKMAFSSQEDEFVLKLTLPNPEC